MVSMLPFIPMGYACTAHARILEQQKAEKLHGLSTLTDHNPLPSPYLQQQHAARVC